MVGFNCMNNTVVLFIFLGILNAEFNVRTFHFVVESLSDIVEKTCTLCRLNIGAEFGSHKTGEVRNLK